MDVAERARLDNNRQRVLALLLDGQWHTSLDLMAVGGLRAVGRLHEVKAEGYDYLKRRKSAGVWEYLLYRPEPVAQTGRLF